MASTVSDVVC